MVWSKRRRRQVSRTRVYRDKGIIGTILEFLLLFWPCSWADGEADERKPGLFAYRHEGPAWDYHEHGSPRTGRDGSIIRYAVFHTIALSRLITPHELGDEYDSRNEQPQTASGLSGSYCFVYNLVSPEVRHFRALKRSSHRFSRNSWCSWTLWPAMVRGKP